MSDSQQVHGRDTTRADGQDGPQRAQGDVASSTAPGPDAQAPHVEPDHDSHGQSTAAWTAVGIVMVGALVMAVAVVIGSVWLFVIGAVIAVLGALSGKVLSAMGFGTSGRPGH
jgi:hypothetical protein